MIVLIGTHSIRIDMHKYVVIWLLTYSYIPNKSQLYLNISQLYALRPLNAWFNHIFIPLHYIPMIVQPPTWTNWLPHHFPWLDPHSLNHIFLKHHLLMLRRLGNSHETAPCLLVKSWFLAGHISCFPHFSWLKRPAAASRGQRCSGFGKAARVVGWARRPPCGAGSRGPREGSLGNGPSG